MAARSPTASGFPAPQWLAHRYDPGHDAVHFIEADRRTRRDAIFLTDEFLTGMGEPLVLRLEEALRAVPPPAPMHFILHSAFCCSTLLANALDRERVAAALKEPVILNDIVGWRRRGAPPAQVAEVLDGALALLARPFADGEAMVVKPSNVVNGLAPALLAMRPDAGALLLYAPLRLFLTSIAKKGLDGRLWVRELFLGFRTDGLVQRLGFDDQAFFGQTDLQIAAVGWLAQQAIFANILATSPPGSRVRSLDSETLLADPRSALRACGEIFGLNLAAADVEDILHGPFSRNSKSGAAFSAQDRVEEYRAAADAHAEEIEKVAIWAEAVAKAAGIPMRLSRNLF